MKELKALTKKILDFRRKRGWEKYHTAKAMAISLVLEAGELLELFQWTKNNRIPKNKRQEFKDELADVLYWVLLIAHDFKIDLPKALEEKIKKNRRKYPLKYNHQGKIQAVKK
jgi:NTP pyrophosphatase (non-canonical NTP hydrolase)